MKHSITLYGVVLSSIFAAILHGADLTVIPFEYAKHAADAKKIILTECNLKMLFLGPITDTERERIAIKTDRVLKENTQYSSIPSVPNTFERIVLCKNNTVIGIADYYLRQGKKMGTIETYCLKEECIPQEMYHRRLMCYAVMQMLAIETPGIETSIPFDAYQEQKAAALALGFIATKSTFKGFNHNYRLYEYTAISAQNLKKID